MKPLKVRTIEWNDLALHYRRAVELAASDYRSFDESDKVRIETYRTADLKRMVEEVWRWSSSLADLAGETRDIQRIRKIMRLQKRTRIWPYVSYWASDIEELLEVERTDAPNREISVLNHGDGWHRLVAAFENKLPTFEILFL